MIRREYPRPIAERLSAPPRAIWVTYRLAGDIGHDGAENGVRDRLGKAGFLAAAMIESRPGDECGPKLQA